MEEPPTLDEVHTKNVDRTLKELQRMVKEHEYALNQVCFKTFCRTTHGSLLTASQLRDKPAPSFPGGLLSAKASLDIMTTAYRTVAESPPILPSHGSVLPALLALRKTHTAILESNDYSKSQGASLEKLRRQLEAGKADLQDQKALQAALERRIETLRHGLESTKQKSPEQIALERVEELQQKRRDYDKETSKLLKAFNNFINEHLGALLAAEELGGPVVGDLMDIDVDELGAGFNAQGKMKKSKGDPDEDLRQRRIDDIWGNSDGRQAKKAKGKHIRDEASAAGAELKDLAEQLLNQLMESAGDNSASYVKIPKETAASRFLVRSKVAQFHPKDATRLRLVDFGRELDD